MAAIIFDFDGTLADSFQSFVGIFYELTGRTDIIDPAEIERLRGMTIPQVIKELDVRPWKVPLLIWRGKRKMGKLMPSIPAHKGVLEVVDKLQGEGHQLYILSSNSEKNIRVFLAKHGALTEFVNIYGNVGLFSKGRALKKVIRRNRLDPMATHYVGDEVRDVVGAHYAGIPIVAVGWGFNTPKILDEHKPTHLVNTPHELFSILEEI